MAFRDIGTLAGEVMERLEMQGRGSSDERAPAPAYPVTGMEVATSTRGKEPMPVAFAQSGEGTAEQTVNGLPVYIAPRTGKRVTNSAMRGGGASETLRELNKGTGANPGQLGGQEERQSEDRRAKGHSSTLRLIYSSKSACIAKSNRQRPTVAAMHPHLVLCVSH